MSWIGATGQNENQEQFDILKDEIDANATYINTLVGVPDPLHTPIFGINILNPGLFGLVERAEVNIKALQLGEEGIGTNISGIETTISGIESSISAVETEISGIQGEITALQGEVGLVQGEVSALSGSFGTFNTITLPLIFTNIGIADGLAGDALGKANKSLGIWDESGNNTYNKKSGNVGIGATFGGVLNNKLEVVGNINIPTGNTYRINDEPFSYSHLAGTPPVSSKWTNATDTITNIYYNTGNVGIGTTSLINNKLEIGGNLNISAGSKYKINNVDLSFSDLGGTLSYNSLTDKLTGGTNISIVGNAINNTYTYTLPTASTSVLGGVKVDGSSITINNGVISGANTYVLPTASTSVLGGVKIDGTTININNGVISSTTGLPATIRLTPTATDGFYSWVNSQSMLAKNPPSGNLYSSGSSAGDIILRSDTDTKLILQSGILDPAITINAPFNDVKFHNRVGINTAPHSTYWLNVNGAINANELRVGGNLINQSKWGNTFENIWYTSGNVGIGTATNTTGVKLDVNGVIESRTAIGANSSFYFRGVANSDLSRVTIAGQLSTGSELNDTILRSTNKLVLQSGTGAPAIVINTANNVGIGTTNPTSKLHIITTSSTNLLDFRNADNFGIYATSLGIGSRGNTLDFLARDYNNGNAIQTRNILSLRPEGNVNINEVLTIGSITGGGFNNVPRLVVYASDSVGTSAIFKHPNDTQGIGIKWDGIFQTNSTTSPFQITSTGTGGILFNTNGTERMRVYTDGSVRTPYGGAFIAQANISRGNGFDIRSVCFSTGMYIEMGLEGTFTPHYLRMGAYDGVTFIQSNSNRSILFDIWSGVGTGTLRRWEFFNNSGSYNPLNSTTWQQQCDQRIKENIVKADLKTCYDNVKNINLYRFKYIDSFQTASQDKNKLGYIAQEVKRHFPKATIRKKERLADKREIPDLLTIDVEQINLTLYGAVKQLIKIVEKQNKRIKTLETLLNIEDNDEVENDAGEEYERIYDEEEVNIDDIEPTEPEQDKAPDVPVEPTENTDVGDEQSEEVPISSMQNTDVPISSMEVSDET